MAHWLIPAVRLAAREKAVSCSSGVSPSRRPAAIQLPKVPITEVGRKPRRPNSGQAVPYPIRAIISYPATMAARTSSIGAPVSSAAAMAAGTTMTPGWALLLR